MKKRLLIFDFDGTIVDSGDIVYLINKSIFRREFNINIRRKEFYNLFNDNFYKNFAKLLYKHKLIGFLGLIKLEFEKKKIQKYVEKLLIELEEHKHHFKPFPNTKNMLENLKKSNIISVVSSDLDNFVKYIIKKYKLNYFDDVLGADFALSKIKKIKHLIKKYKMPRDKVIYIGDTIGDIVEAKKSGIKCIAITYGFHSKNHFAKSDIKADYYANNTKELFDIINHLE